MCGRDYAGRLTAAHNQARRLTAGPVSEPGDKRVVEVGAPPPLNTQSGGCRRIRTSFEGSSGPPHARVRQDMAQIRAEGWVAEVGRAG